MKKLEKFLQAINYKGSPEFLSGEFISNQIQKDGQNNPQVSIVLGYKQFLPISEIKNFEVKTKKYKHRVFTKYEINEKESINITFDYLKYIIDLNKFIFGNTLKYNDIEISDKLKIIVYSNDSLNNWNKYKLDILNLLINYGFKFNDIIFILSQKDVLAEDSVKLKNEIKKFKEKQELNKKIIETNQISIRNPKISSREINLEDVDQDLVKSYEGGKVSFIAELVGKPEIKEISDKNLIILNMILTDYVNSIKGTVYHNIILDNKTEKWKQNSFHRKEKLFQFIKSLKSGDVLHAVGNLKINIRNTEIYLDIFNLSKAPNKFSTSDHEHKKRVEFHTHTKMSSLDGIPMASEYIKKAIEWGHEAIAITDHDSLQSFPEAYDTIRWNKDNKFKIIYGVEASIVDDKSINIISNYKDVILKDQEFIFFDLETTGLSARFNEIIEFGAVKVKNHIIIEKKQMFIKPDKEIPSFISEITNITNDLVKDSPKLKDVIREIREWIGEDSVLVAHNADFDIGFLNNAYLSNGLNKINNMIIDTLRLSWTMHTTRNHRLGTIAKYYNVPYDTSIAHRADYDAEILSVLFFSIQDILEQDNNFNVKSLKKMSQKNLHKIFPTHTTIYAKNQKGLKDLYEIISLSHTKYINKNPRIPKSEIEKRRKNLIIGSSCEKGEIFNMISNDSTNLENVIDFYDFFEIMPLDALTHLIYTQKLTQEEIIQVNKDIYALGKKHKKLVIATGNVHYINPLEKKIREIFVYNKGLGGTFHPLFDFKKRIKEIPNNYFRTTKNMKKSFVGAFSKEIIQEIVVDNSIKLSQQFEIVKPIQDELFPPKINNNPGKKLSELVYKNGEALYGPKDKWHEIISKRIERELSSIIKHGYAEIYLISSEIVQESIRNGFLVGSRGSVGSSIVATLSDITEVNPLAPHYYCTKCHYIEFNNEYDCGYDLPDKQCPKCKINLEKEGHDIPFETFLGFEGDKIPDIDLNFAREYQLKAHDYTRKMFGEENVFRAGTISTLAGQTSYGFIMNWAEQKGLQDSLSKAELERLQQKLIGSKRTTGQHPGGLIVVPKEKSIYDFTPINHPANDTKEHKTTHFDFHAIHDNLLKLDLLGHLDPSAIKMLENLTGINAKKIPKSDNKVLELFNGLSSMNIDPKQINGETIGTIGVPEFGTKFVREMLSDTKPKSFADLVRISGLSHGTDVWLNNAKNLIINNVAELKDTIACRDDIMVYLMKKGLNAQLAFNIMENVRKGKGLTQEEIKKMKEKHVEDWYINSCKAIKYMFPKAHATAYVLMAWRVAWFKIHYPLEYYATFFSTRCDFFDVVSMEKGPEAIIPLLDELNIRDKSKRGSGIEPLNVKEKGIMSSLESTLELYARGFKIQSIKLNISLVHNWIVDLKTNSLIPPFSTIDGLGETTADSIINARENLSNNEFSTKEEFLSIVKINNTLLGILEEYGLFKEIRDSNQLSIFDFE